MAIVVAAWNGALLRFPSSPSLPPTTNPSFPKWRRKKKQGPLRGSFCFSLKPNQRREAEAEELGGADGLADAFLSSARDDSNYLWKLAAGSVGGASAIKYGDVGELVRGDAREELPLRARARGDAVEPRGRINLREEGSLGYPVERRSSGEASGEKALNNKEEELGSSLWRKSCAQEMRQGKDECGYSVMEKMVCLG